MSDTNFFSDSQKFGNEVFGPFLTAYMTWLRDNIAKYNPEKVFFFSRDGFLMKACYDILENQKPLGSPSEYVYFSRKSLRTPLLWTKPSVPEIFDFLSWQRFISYKEVLSFWGLSDKEIKNSLSGKQNTTIPYQNLQHDKGIKSLFELHKETIVRRSKEQYDALKQYLSQINFSGNSVIVDIGWHGTMQYAIEKICRQIGIQTNIYGLYVGIGQTKKLEGSTGGYIYSRENDPKRTEVLCFFGGVEKLFQSFEGTTLGYEFANGIAAPILDKFEYDLSDPVVKIIKEIQTGALEYVKSGLPGNPVPLLKFGQNPPSKWLSVFNDFYNIDGGTKVFFLPQKRLLDYGVKEFIYALNMSPWKTGFMKKAFKLPLPYFLLYKLMKK